MHLHCPRMLHFFVFVSTAALSQRQKIFERNIHYINRKYTFMASHVVTSSSSACIHFCESTFLVNRFCLNPLNPNYPESLLPESPESTESGFKCCSRTESTYWIRILNAVALPESPESIHLNPNLNAVAQLNPNPLNPLNLAEPEYRLEGGDLAPVLGEPRG